MNSLVTPIQRNLKFKLPIKTVTDWNKAGRHVTQFLNTMSIFFPEGERFFIKSVRNYRHEVTDPDLQKAVKAFIGQEAMHGREHDEYNQALIKAGFPVDKMEAQVTSLLHFIQNTMPTSFQLGVTIGLEHLTAIFADTLLKHPEFLEGAEPHFAALWQWHALEETEHKAVAFDVYKEVMGKSLKGYALRATTLVVATSIFFAMLYTYYFQILKSKEDHTNLRGWLKSLSYQWLMPGMIRKTVPAWLDYFKPGFHPWDHDNREFLDLISELESRVAEFSESKTLAVN
jgi:predicted metal-dependent hydrolase